MNICFETNITCYKIFIVITMLSILITYFSPINFNGFDYPRAPGWYLIDDHTILIF